MAHITSQYSPFGGIWEASVKSMKRQMRRVIAQQILTDEEFLPVINQIGAVLIWSPVFPMLNDINASGALTAGHFFIDDSIVAVFQSNIKLSSYQEASQ